MGEKRYDAIVVGARCAGSPTAMLLARKGYDVLLVDRATFPSDTISTHIVHPPGIASLRRWGLLERLLATGCPPIATYAFDLGPFTLAGSPGAVDEPLAYCPRRTVLDKLLVEAAAAAGAEVREGANVEELILSAGCVAGVRGHDTSGTPFKERARVVIGADGRHSLVARLVGPEQYNEKPPLLCGYYTYWSGLPMDGRFESYLRPGRGFAAAPTHDDLTLVIGGWPFAEFEANKRDLEGNYLAMFELVPEFAARLRGARRVARLAGAAVRNYFRTPYGPGWALVGDAGYNKDFITAQGISDAFRDAELLSDALDEALSGACSFEVAMDEYQAVRDEQVLPMYDFTCQLATLEPPPPALLQLLAAARGNQEAMDAFARVNAGVMSPAEFLSVENIARIVNGASAGAGAGAPPP
jgi:2-polyprenyl-6-methoxyphenol hydroxylase-like FAD-dependent oxidoreductase